MSDKPLIILHGCIRTPPLSFAARQEAGVLLRLLQRRHSLSLPSLRPMPAIGPRCHELRIDDVDTRRTWRIIYRVDRDAVVVVELFAKKTKRTPLQLIATCRQRLRQFDQIIGS